MFLLVVSTVRRTKQLGLEILNLKINVFINNIDVNIWWEIECATNKNHKTGVCYKLIYICVESNKILKNWCTD